MEKIIAKLEELIEKMITEFKEHPVKTGLMALFAYWIIKAIYREVKG
jgi:hypothetical protein